MKRENIKSDILTEWEPLYGSKIIGHFLEKEKSDWTRNRVTLRDIK